MARVVWKTGSAPSTKLHGLVNYNQPLGIKVFDTPRSSIATIRPRAIPAQPWTPAQAISQANFALAAYNWNIYGLPNKAAWDFYAPPPLTGYQLFMQFNMYLLTWGFNAIPDLPAYSQTPQVSFVNMGTCSTTGRDFIQAFAGSDAVPSGPWLIHIYIQLSTLNQQLGITVPNVYGTSSLGSALNQSGFVFIGTVGPLNGDPIAFIDLDHDLQNLIGFVPTYGSTSVAGVGIGPRVLMLNYVVSDIYGKPALVNPSLGNGTVIYTNQEQWLPGPEPSLICPTLAAGYRETAWRRSRALGVHARSRGRLL